LELILYHGVKKRAVQDRGTAGKKDSAVDLGEIRNAIKQVCCRLRAVVFANGDYIIGLFK